MAAPVDGSAAARSAAGARVAAVVARRYAEARATIAAQRAAYDRAAAVVAASDGAERGRAEADRDAAERAWLRALGAAAELEGLADAVGVALPEDRRRYLPGRGGGGA